MRRIIEEAFYYEPVLDVDGNETGRWRLLATLWDREESDPPGRLVGTKIVEYGTNAEREARVSAAFAAIEESGRVPADIQTERVVNPRLPWSVNG